MECPIDGCGGEFSEWYGLKERGFGDIEEMMRVMNESHLGFFRQCSENPNHIFFIHEADLSEELFLKTISEREKRIPEIIRKLSPAVRKRYPKAELKMNLIHDEGKGGTKKILLGLSGLSDREHTMTELVKNMERLINKYAMTFAVLDLERRK